MTIQKSFHFLLTTLLVITGVSLLAFKAFAQSRSRLIPNLPGEPFLVILSGSAFSNARLITLFKNSGLHHLRLGATGSSSSDTRNLDQQDNATGVSR